MCPIVLIESPICQGYSINCIGHALALMKGIVESNLVGHFVWIPISNGVAYK